MYYKSGNVKYIKVNFGGTKCIYFCTNKFEMLLTRAYVKKIHK